VTNKNNDPKNIKPIETDGIFQLTLGTMIFSGATLVLIYFPQVAGVENQMLLLRITILGSFLGVLGLLILKRRKKRLNKKS
jgi:hypothetical protein